MSGAPIHALNTGLAAFREEVSKDEQASLRVEVALVAFVPVRLTQNFVTIDNLTPPKLIADGVTPMGEAINYWKTARKFTSIMAFSITVLGCF